MIYDTLHNARLYEGLGPGFQRAFAYLTSNDLAALAPGRYDIDGNQVYLMIQEDVYKRQLQQRYALHGVRHLRRSAGPNRPFFLDLYLRPAAQAAAEHHHRHHPQGG